MKKKTYIFLRRLGIYKTWLMYQTWRKNKIQKKYRDIPTFTVTINGNIVKFSTVDDYSNSWFFPRYFGGKLHEQSVTRLLLKNLRSTSCFADVGANLGWYTCLASKQIPQGRVCSFEMDNLAFELLQKNVSLNHCQNVETVLAAISDEVGTTQYERKCKSPDPTFRILSKQEKSNLPVSVVSVPSITLDSFFQARQILPDVVKIDVEGAEMQVLKGMSRILSEKKPVLFLEVHPWNLPIFHTSIEDIFILLTHNKYTLFEIRNMRRTQDQVILKKITAPQKLTKNTMLYAVPPNLDELENERTLAEKRRGR